MSRLSLNKFALEKDSFLLQVRCYTEMVEVVERLQFNVFYYTWAPVSGILRWHLTLPYNAVN